MLLFVRFVFVLVVFLLSTPLLAANSTKRSNAAAVTEGMSAGDDNPIVLIDRQGDLQRSLRLGARADMDYADADQDLDYLGPGKDGFVLALAELSADISFNRWVNGRVSVIKTDDINRTDNKFKAEVDEAYLAVGNFEDSPYYVSIGRYYLPFGVYRHHTITSTVTKDLSEINGNAIGVGFEKKLFYGSVYAYTRDGNVNRKAATVYPVSENFGAEFGLAKAYKHWGYHLYAGYLNNLATVASISSLQLTNVNEVSALALHAEYYIDRYGVTLDYTTALNHFNTNGITFDGSGARPNALSMQLFYHFVMLQRASTIAVGYQSTNNALAIFLPKWRYTATYSIQLTRPVELILQYEHSRDYRSTNSGGFTGPEGAETVTGTGGNINTYTARLSIKLGNAMA